MELLQDRLKKRREELGLTQTELAVKARLKNQSIIGSLESGHRKKSSHIPAIAAALMVDSVWLSDGSGNKESTSSAVQSIISVQPARDPILDDLAALEDDDAAIWQSRIDEAQATLKRLHNEIRAAANKARRQKQGEDRTGAAKSSDDPPQVSRRTA